MGSQVVVMPKYALNICCSLGNAMMYDPEQDGLYKYGRNHIFLVYLVHLVQTGGRLLQNRNIDHHFFTISLVKSDEARVTAPGNCNACGALATRISVRA